MTQVHRAAVLGKPIAHSLSPVIHNAGYAAAGLTGWSYAAIECAEAELPDLVAGLGPEWAGLSLTMPLKEVALAVAGEVSPVAAAVGAANTLVRRADGSWYADNTDVPGMVEALRAAGVTTARSVAVLGAGGTARAALAAAQALCPGAITVYARRPEAIDQLRAVGVPLTGALWTDAARCGEADVVISTVPKGVADHLIIHWRPSTVLFDVVYDPWPTPLAAAAQAAGCRIVSGLDLLLAQAVGQFEQFTGVPAPVPAMRDALARARRPRTRPSPGPSTTA
ncbi:MAG: shikimate dehydrogenase [Micromonosporaceae bacterium]|nr:shikimate dehydrogenase [Micromonosporaceae bacterium]